MDTRRGGGRGTRGALDPALGLVVLWEGCRGGEGEWVDEVEGDVAVLGGRGGHDTTSDGTDKTTGGDGGWAAQQHTYRGGQSREGEGEGSERRGVLGGGRMRGRLGGRV